MELLSPPGAAFDISQKWVSLQPGEPRTDGSKRPPYCNQLGLCSLMPPAAPRWTRSGHRGDAVGLTGNKNWTPVIFASSSTRNYAKSSEVGPNEQTFHLHSTFLADLRALHSFPGSLIRTLATQAAA